MARFIPDCLVLFRRLLADGRVPRVRKLALVLMLGYLVLPIDLIPDFIPVAGQLDDAILVALTLQFVPPASVTWLGSSTATSGLSHTTFAC